MRAGNLRGPHGRFIAGVGDHQRLALVGEGEHRVVERLAGAGKRHHRLGIEALHLGEGRGQVFLHVHQVAAATGNDVDHGLARGVAGAEGVLIGVDVNALVGIGEVGTLGQREMGFGEDGHAGQGGGAGGKAEETAAGEGRYNQWGQQQAMVMVGNAPSNQDGRNRDGLNEENG
jgi:hypothetical protein